MQPFSTNGKAGMSIFNRRLRNYVKKYGNRKEKPRMNADEHR